MDDLQRRVDQARVEAKARGEGSATLPAKGEAETPIAASSSSDDQAPDVRRETIEAATTRRQEVAVAKSDHGSDATGVKNEADIVPVPLKFVFREATLTEEGRRAADLLLEYLLLKQLPSVTLTGHADERGTAAFNLSLSAERLQTVANFLRAGGYAGKLILIPKGDTEPFTGIDRRLFSRADLYDLDRRVELRLPTERSAAELSPPVGGGAQPLRVLQMDPHDGSAWRRPFLLERAVQVPRVAKRARERNREGTVPSRLMIL